LSQYDLNLADISELWRRGSIVASWLLDLTAEALLHDAERSTLSGRVSDSGEGRWTVPAAVDAVVPAPVLTTALYQQFNARGEADYAVRLWRAYCNRDGPLGPECLALPPFP
jgi:6-phosphogluconate dehydrogenase